MDRALRAIGLGSAVVLGWHLLVAVAAAGYCVALGFGGVVGVIAVPFAIPFAAASAVSAALTWAIGGDRRRALAFLAVGPLVVALPILASYLPHWGPLDGVRVAVKTVRMDGQLMRWAVVGLAFGVPAGLAGGSLLVLSRRWPVAAALIAIGLVGLAPSAADLAIERLTAWRNEGGHWKAVKVDLERMFPTGLGAGFGAIAGATLAGFTPGRRREDAARPG